MRRTIAVVLASMLMVLGMVLSVVVVVRKLWPEVEEDVGSGDATAAHVMMGLGVACVVLGLLLHFWSWRRSGKDRGPI